jgi:cytochrome oxidase assembly protein ShyY1
MTFPRSTLILIAILITSCSPNRLLKRAERLTNKAIQKGAIVQSDTIFTDRTILIPEHHTDTLIQVKTFRDTIRLENERIKWKIKVNEKTIFVDAKCKADTVIIRVPVEVTRTVKPNRNTFAIIVWSALGGMLLLIVGYFILKRKSVTVNVVNRDQPE